MVCMENSNAFLKLRITTLDPTNPTVLSLCKEMFIQFPTSILALATELPR